MYKHLEDTFENNYGRWRVTVWLRRPYVSKEIVERKVRVSAETDPISHTKSVRLHKVEKKGILGLRTEIVKDPDAPSMAEHIEQTIEETMEKNERLIARDRRTLADVGVDL